MTNPAAIQNCNGWMEGIDMMLYIYLDEQGTLRHWKKVCSSIFS
jgi:hypothetical protein